MNNIKEQYVNFDPNDLVFDNKVREACKCCKRFGSRATCPPHCETVEYYEKTLTSYKKGKFIITKYLVKDISQWKELGEESTKYLNGLVLKERDKLIQEGHYFCIGFGGGSCKNCQKCIFPCPYPNKSLVPIEGTGVNVVKTLKKYIKIKFPVDNFFYRIGVVLYD